MTNYIIFLGKNLISWGAKKHAIVSRSIVEVENRALASELMWFVHLLNNVYQGVPPLKLYCDNSSAIHMAKNLVFHHRTKHIKIDVHFVREWVASGALSLTYIPRPD